MHVHKEVEAAIDWVKKYADNWPEVEWEKKDLESLCVIVPNRHVVRPCMCTQVHRFDFDAHHLQVYPNVPYVYVYVSAPLQLLYR